MKTKKIIYILLLQTIFISGFISCEKQDEPSGKEDPERELSIPEKVEKDLMTILSNRWQELADTLHYFDSTMLSQGKTKGYGPDSVYYELDIKMLKINELQAEFKIQDTTWVLAWGKILPLELYVNACNTDIYVKRAEADTLSLTVENIEVLSPADFLVDSLSRAALLYEDERVGYITRDTYENLDYSTGTYLTLHYYNDPRTFSFYDNGILGLTGTISEIL